MSNEVDMRPPTTHHFRLKGVMMKVHDRSGVVRVSWLLVVAIALAPSEEKALAQGAPTALLAWDTGKSTAEPLAAEAVAHKSGWQLIASDETAHAFKGDAAISNGRVLALARKHGMGVELYSLGSGKPVFRARLLLAPGAET